LGRPKALDRVLMEHSGVKLVDLYPGLQHCHDRSLLMQPQASV